MSNQFKYQNLSAENTALLLIDHQVGLMQTVRDMQTTEEFKNNVLGLAKTAKVFNLPTVLTTSVDTGPNGLIMSEIRDIFPDAPLIRRPGPINAWRWPEFREAALATGKKRFIVAAITADTCLQFPAIDMISEGLEVYGVIDASGSWSPIARDIVIPRLISEGVKVANWVSIACELQWDWRNEKTANQMVGVFKSHLPSWGFLAENWMNTKN